MFSNRRNKAEKTKTKSPTIQTPEEEQRVGVQSPKNTDQLKVKGQFS